MVIFTQKTLSCADALDLPAPDRPSGLPVIFVVAAALIDTDGRILLAQRPEGKSMAGLWEFPGGKVHEDETPEFALMRELREELEIETRPCCFSPAGFASHSYADFHLMMPLFICRTWKGIPRATEGQTLKWVYPKDMYEYEMPAADVPLVECLSRTL